MEGHEGGQCRGGIKLVQRVVDLPVPARVTPRSSIATTNGQCSI